MSGTEFISASGGSGVVDGSVDGVDLSANAFTAIAASTALTGTYVRKGELRINVLDHGVMGDGVTDDTSAINALIASFGSSSPSGAVLYFPPGDYVVGGINLASGIFLDGERPHYGYLPSGSAWTTRFKASGAVSALVTATGSIFNAGVRGIDFDGRGLASRGVYWPSATWCTIRDVHMNNFLDPFVQIDGGNACRIHNFLGVNGLRNLARSANTGSIQIGGNDHWLSDIETAGKYTAGALTSGLYNAALYVTGTSIFFHNVVAELSEVGIRVDASGRGNRFTGCRADRNGAHGWVIASNNNILSGCHSASNAREATNTYMGFTTSGLSNVFSACNVTANSGENNVRYCYEDTQTGWSKDVRNEYQACGGVSSTARFRTDSFAGSAPVIANHPVRVADGTATPDVGGASLIYLATYTTPTTVTDFVNGVVGQALTVIGNSNVTISNGATIKTATGATEALSSNGVYRFTNYNGVWYEDAAPTNLSMSSLTSTFARLPQIPHALRKVGFIGDSITNGSTGGDTYTTSMSGIVENADSPPTYALLNSNGQWDLIINAGIAGQRSDQIAARLQADIIGNGVDICVLYSCFANDLGASFTVSQTIANITGMVTALLNAGVLPVLCTPTPQPSGASSAAKTWIQEARRRTISLARQYNVPLVDLTPVLIDPLTGVLAAAYYATDLHPTTAGRWVGGQAVAAVLNRICNGGWAGTCAVGDSDDLLGGNGFFATDSNSDGLANNWTRAGNAGPVCSLYTDPIIGRMQRITSSGTASSTTFTMSTFPPVTGGHVLEVSGYLSKSGAIAPQISITDGIGGSRKFSPSGSVPDFTRGRFTYRYTLPQASTGLAIVLVVGAGTGTVDFGQVTIRDLTALGIA